MSRTTIRLFVTVALIACAQQLRSPTRGTVRHSSLLAGFIHPFSGIDHLLAMTAVGLIAVQLGGRALWAVPTTFVSVMALGGIFGAAGLSLPFTETAIALSVLVFGLVILSGMTLPVLAAMALVGVFAFFHGYAHGPRCRSNGSGMLYGGGFMVATALLHGFGITLGLAVRRFDEAPRRRVMQACGIAIGLIGTGLVFGLVIGLV